jgi:hypothetical protein
MYLFKKIQLRLFKVEVSPKTSVGIYTIPFIASIMIQTTATSTRPIFKSGLTMLTDPIYYREAISFNEKDVYLQ